MESRHERIVGSDDWGKLRSAPWVYWFFPIIVFLFIASSAFAAKPAVNVPKILQIDSPYLGSQLFVPNDGKPHPGIILLHGSEGGSLPYYRLEAQLMAMHGYAVLAFCWYNCAQNPISSPFQTLENIDLNKTLDAMSWLKASAYVAGKKTAVYGFSRGAEQTLLLAWKTAADGKNLPDAIAVHAPSDTVVGGFTWAVMDSRCWLCTTFDLKCFNGSKDPSDWEFADVRWNPACGEIPKDPALSPKTAWINDGQPLTIGARIEIEKYTKPIFISHGTKDELWEHDRSLRLKETLERAGRFPEVHIFDGEKHNFSSPAENHRRGLLIRYFKKVLN